MTRPSEAVNAKWEEINFKTQLWTIPANKMKMKREHIVSLSPQAISILQRMKPISGHREYVFPSMKPPYLQPMNSSTANIAIKRMGYKDTLVAHGLRSLASTILNNSLKFHPDVIESALAHSDKNSVRKVYNNAKYLDAKKELFVWCGQFVADASLGSNSLCDS